MRTHIWMVGKHEDAFNVSPGLYLPSVRTFSLHCIPREMASASLTERMDSAIHVRWFGDEEEANKHCEIANANRPFVGRELRKTLKWCKYLHVTVKDGIVILYKAVNFYYRSSYHDNKNKATWIIYKPGSIPTAPDWDGGQEECGGGLHFGPTPYRAGAYFKGHGIVRYLACPVAISDIRPPSRLDLNDDKIKAWKCCAPIWEVNGYGRPLSEPEIKDK